MEPKVIEASELQGRPRGGNQGACQKGRRKGAAKDGEKEGGRGHFVICMLQPGLGLGFRVKGIL